MTVAADVVAWETARHNAERGTGTQAAVATALTTLTTSLDALFASSAPTTARAALLDAFFGASRADLASRMNTEAAVQSLVKLRAAAGGKSVAGL